MIEKNSAKISNVSTSIIDRDHKNKVKITKLSNLISENENKLSDKISSVSTSLSSINIRVDDNDEKIEKMSTKNSVCGYRYKWTSEQSTITYQQLKHSDTSMGETGLDISTGMMIDYLALKAFFQS